MPTTPLVSKCCDSLSNFDPIYRFLVLNAPVFSADYVVALLARLKATISDSCPKKRPLCPFIKSTVALARVYPNEISSILAAASYIISQMKNRACLLWI